MIYDPKEITLRDRGRYLLRAPDPERDAVRMLDYLRRVRGETEFLSGYPEELTLTPEQEAFFLRSCLEDPNRLPIVAEQDGRLAGMCELVLNNREKTRHRSQVSIALLKWAWGMGLGGAMVGELLHAARVYGCTQVELGVLEQNRRAIALYEKLGFVRYGVLPQAYRLRDGSYQKEVLMVCWLS